MTANKACYRKLTHYKYQLMQEYDIWIKVLPQAAIDTQFIQLSIEGHLIIKKFYAWDGPSGPSIDTLTFMRGSLVHDALYQLMREGHLSHIEHRKSADDILKEICLADGMSSFRAWYVYKAVRLFGEHSALPTDRPSTPTICVP
ncbi:MAG: DUF1353 domain-containing protein [Bacteriovoracaceae bacterium]|nr:DUF1353 domain-containing protein [Candidatus Brocadiales bacterium]MBL6990500.1 DUF1353 domain-containing protein [Bacteriovoracaceae bacterium]MBL7110293.1 DUF1353 domain-containing protein [Candidatus Neomarinimicrobiota bacterium]